MCRYITPAHPRAGFEPQRRPPSSPGRVQRSVELVRLLPALLGSALHRVPSITERRLATMASADSCPITGRVTPPSAVLVSAISTGWASLGSLAAWRRPNTRGAWTWSAGSPPALNPLDPPTSLTAPSSRSPRIRTWIVAAPPRHLPYPSDRWASSCCADSPPGLSLLWRFCSSARSWAAGFLQTPPRGDALALGLQLWPTPWAWSSCRGLAPHESTPMPGVHNGMQPTALTRGG